MWNVLSGSAKTDYMTPGLRRERVTGAAAQVRMYEATADEMEQYDGKIEAWARLRTCWDAHMQGAPGWVLSPNLYPSHVSRIRNGPDFCQVALGRILSTVQIRRSMTKLTSLPHL